MSHIQAYETAAREINATYDATYAAARDAMDAARRVARETFDAAINAANETRKQAKRDAAEKLVGEVTDPFGQWLLKETLVDYPSQTLALLVELPMSAEQVDEWASVNRWDYVWEEMRPRALRDGVITETPVSAARHELIDWVKRNYSVNSSTLREINQRLNALIAAEVAAATEKQAGDPVAAAE